MKKQKWLHLINVKIKGTYPLNPKSMELALKIWNKEISPEDLPPIKVQCDEKGVYWIKDGRHRFIALKMCGFKKIKAIVSYPNNSGDKNIVGLK